MAQPVTVKLKHPIEIGSQRFEEITIQPMKAKHLLKCEKSEDDKVGWCLELAGYMSGNTSHMIGELEGEDIWEVVAAVASFFAGGQTPGSEA